MNNLKSSLSVMVVDDDWINRELMQTILESAGYKVQTVSAGEKALQLIQQAPPAMVIVDLRLSDISGLEVCERIRAMHLDQRVVIVVMSALDNDTSRHESLAAGADIFLSKMFSVPELLNTLNGLVTATH